MMFGIQKKYKKQPPSYYRKPVLKKLSLAQPMFAVDTSKIQISNTPFTITKSKYPLIFERLHEIANREQVTVEQIFALMLKEELDFIENELLTEKERKEKG